MFSFDSLLFDEFVEEGIALKNAIASYALNRLPSKYVATTQGELMTKLCEFDNQFETQVMAAITLGANVIKKNPRHDMME